MSIYRFARFTLLVALFKRYRQRFLRLFFALAFALTTAWLYEDVAVYISQHHPAWAGWALLLKTLLVYAALFLICWEISRMVAGESAAEPLPVQASRHQAPAPSTASVLDELAEKPKLRHRRDEILHTSKSDGVSRR